MQDGCVHARGGCVDEDAASLDVATDLVHDATAAHALMQAINSAEMDGYEVPADELVHEQTIDSIRRIADRLMREWGFGEDGND